MSRWRCIAAVGALSLLLYGAAYLAQGGGDPFEIVSNIVLYVRNQPVELARFNHLAELSTHSHGAWEILYPRFIRAGEAASLVCMAICFFARRDFNVRRMTALTLALMSSELMLRTQAYSADYSQIFFLFLVFLEREYSRTARTLVTAAYLACIPLDVTFLPVIEKAVGVSGAARPVSIVYGLTLGQFVRPVIFLTIQAALIRLNLRAPAPSPPVTLSATEPPRAEQVVESPRTGTSKLNAR